jgi:N-acetylated-alpha-linked acidic dipeptidase
VSSPWILRAGVAVATATLAVASGLYVATQAPASPPRPIFGFSTNAAARQSALEDRLLALPSAERTRRAHEFLTSEPHVAGSPRDRALAEWIRDEWTSYGFDEVEIVEHEVLLPYPEEVSVSLAAPTPTPLSMKEEPIDGDPVTARTDVGIPHHAYSASGEVTAPLVYAGSGNPADYDWLASQGIDIKGKIALVRYSVPYSYRGFKALTAERRGAAGLLIYSDPADDGYGKGAVYPDGPWGPASHIQRGGIVYDFMVPGDPLTPGWASVPRARRIDATKAVSLPKIISAPLSWKDAEVLLRALEGPEAPERWQGKLPLTYRVGGGSATVRMRVKMDDQVRPIWTVIGRIRGTLEPDRTVIVGNHRDAWIFGGVDPSSGTASQMELARALGALVRDGQRPARTLVFASWDAEEFTLTSSTEWGEQFEKDLSANAIAYLNVDSSASGPRLSVAAVPSLNRLITEVAGRVQDPAASIPLIAAWRDRRTVESGALPTGASNELVNNRLGSGSDYTVFLNFLGVPVADLTFDGPYGVYHSIYDSHQWVARFGDPGFRYHVTMAQFWGVIALRLANAELLPLDYTPYADRVLEFLTDLEQASPSPADIAAALAPARAAAERLKTAAALAAASGERLLQRDSPSRTDLASANLRLMRVERAFLDPAGIPGRPWYRHLIYAPKFTYAPELLPGVAEALAARDNSRLAGQVARLTLALDRATRALTP